MTHADRNTVSGRPAASAVDAAVVRTVLLIPLLQIAACNTTTVKHENTLTRLEQMAISVLDEKIEDSLHKAMESYHKYIKQAPASTIKPEAIHRLADLEDEKSYRIEDVETPTEPGARAAIDHDTRLLAELYLEYAPEEETIARWAMEVKQRTQ